MSLRFHGNPTAEVDRVKVPIDPQVAADLGGDLTVEFWLKTEPGANPVHARARPAATAGPTAT